MSDKIASRQGVLPGIKGIFYNDKRVNALRKHTNYKSVLTFNKD